MSDDGMPDEVQLVGEGVTVGIVRVGDTVRRPARPFSQTVQSYLAHLHSRGFHDAPLPLGYDSEGREVLSYVVGEVPREPLPEFACASEVLIALAKLIRHLHDCSDGWVPPRDAVWGRIPGSPQQSETPLFESAELVSHQDYCPGNVVFRRGLPAALIDFDLAKPTTRIHDIANALYWWAPLLDPIDRAPALAEADVPSRVRLFADSYGMTAEQRAGLVPLAVRMIHRFHLSARAAAEADPVFRSMWNDGVRDRMPRAESWISAHATAIADALSGPSGQAPGPVVPG